MLKITFKSENNIVLPFNYKHILQAVFYGMIKEDDNCQFWHDEGYSYEKRKYKLFVFSDIAERPIKTLDEKKQFVFEDKVTVYIASVEKDFLNFIVESFAENRPVRLGSNDVVISAIERIDIDINEKMLVRTLSPVTIYTTFTEPSKKTYYYSPMEKDFGALIRKNLIKKYTSYYGKEPENDKFEIRASGRAREVYNTYKGFIVKGYMGRFEISGSRELMEMAFYSGIGGKNAQGNGFIMPI